MACYHPITMYRSKAGRSSSGKWPLVSNPSLGYVDMPVQVPCGQCVGCRLERSRQWAMRCVHEASLWSQNCFITLTYRDMPAGDSLNVRDYQLFMKRLRKRFPDIRIRFYQCGEYGEMLSRPHHHAILFNFDFADKVLWSVRQGVRLYRSATLEELWPHGYSTIGDCTFESAAYVARYCLKKITGPSADAFYGDRMPEYTTMSRRPGIGRDWLERFASDVYPHDYVVIRDGIKCKPPRYYDEIYDRINPEKMEKVRIARRIYTKKAEDNNVPQRLAVREKVAFSRVKRLRRQYEEV